MNLLKLFNKNYLFQNLKKSKGLLAIILGLIPVFSFVVILTLLTNDENNVVASLESISTINFIGIFVIPIVLAVCLFGFVFKKKSVDFVNSMPISRLSIFITNAIGGILIILAIVIINCLLYLLLSVLFSSFILPIGVLFDYFVVWTISYIFVFMVANLAVTLSGNLITSIILVALGLFLAPFTYDYTKTMINPSINYQTTVTCNDETCKPEEYFCYGDATCESNKKLGMYNLNLTKNYEQNFTLPYSMVRYAFAYEGFEIFNPISLLKMGLLSILYFIIGIFTFKNRKMENCETSFQSIHIHLIVKCLTMVPIVILFIEMISKSASNVFSLIIAVILIAYYFIYDLITKKGIQKVSLSLIYFLGFILLMYGFTTIVHQQHNQNLKSIDIKDIESVAVAKIIYSDTEENEILADIYLNNKELINLIIKESLEGYGYKINSANFNIKLKDGTIYKLEAGVSEEAYKEIMNYFYKDETVLDNFKNINIDNAIAIGIGDFVLKIDNYRSLLELVKEELANVNLKEYFDKNSYSNDIRITYYIYENHKVEKHTVLTEHSEKLNNYLANFYNEKIQSLKSSEDVYFHTIRYQPDKYLGFDEVAYLMNAEVEDTFKFIKDLSKEKFDITKPYVIIYMNKNARYYSMYTNKVEKFEEYLDILREKYKNNSEYQSIIKPYDEVKE